LHQEHSQDRYDDLFFPISQRIYDVFLEICDSLRLIVKGTESMKSRARTPTSTNLFSREEEGENAQGSCLSEKLMQMMDSMFPDSLRRQCCASWAVASENVAAADSAISTFGVAFTPSMDIIIA
jgi:hypothetical protein